MQEGCPSLMGIEIRGRARSNLRRSTSASQRQVQDFNRALLPALAVLDSFVQEFVRLPCRFRGSTHHRDPAITAVIRSTGSTHIFVFDVVGEGNCRLARGVWLPCQSPTPRAP